MIYVCSDIHGRYDRWIRLLETINFGPEDTMYVLGDVIDRGPDGVKILLDIASRNNVTLFLGNHEHMMLMSLADVFAGNERSEMLNLWTYHRNGGDVTLAQFLAASEEEQNTVLEMLQNALALKIVEVNGKKFHLSHTFTLSTIEKNEYKATELSNKELERVCWLTPLRNDDLFVPVTEYKDDYCYIIGHVPVQRLIGTDTIGVVAVNDHIIDIDLGCALGDKVRNYLGCLRLDDMEVFYIGEENELL